MFLLWGARTLLQILRTGTFRCPSCDSDTRYSLVQPRRWFTFFFIPIFPYRTDDEVVRCEQCQSLWDTAVLKIPTTEQLQSDLAVAARALVATSVQPLPNHAVPVALTIVSGRIASFTGNAYDANAFLQDLGSFQDTDVVAYIQPMASVLNEQGKENLILLAFESAYFFGYLDPANRTNLSASLGQTGVGNPPFSSPFWAS